MTWKIPLKEKVPGDYHRLYMFFGAADFKAVLRVDGTQELHVGETGDPTDKETERACMNWQGRTVAEIRNELQRLEGLNPTDLKL